MGAPRLRAPAAVLGLLLYVVLGRVGPAEGSGRGVTRDRLCPVPCRCLEDLLDCSRQRLARLPEPLPPWVARLDLSHNRLSVIKASSMSHLQSLREVKLNNNELETIPNLGPVSANVTLLSFSSLPLYQIPSIVMTHFLHVAVIAKLVSKIHSSHPTETCI